MIWVAFLIGLVLGIVAGFEIQWRLIMGAGKFMRHNHAGSWLDERQRTSRKVG